MVLFLHGHVAGEWKDAVIVCLVMIHTLTAYGFGGGGGGIRLDERVHNEAKSYVHTQAHTRIYIYKAV